MSKKVISFSGGRSSGMMLIRLAEKNLIDNSIIQFADTGREYPQTYDFVNQVEEFIGQKILRLSYPKGDYESPFDAMLAKKKMLPNQSMRFCTVELKVIPMMEFLRDDGCESYTNLIGFRADEARRVFSKEKHSEFAYHIKTKKVRIDTEKVASQRNAKDFKFIELNHEFPLYNDGIKKTDVLKFWDKMPFNLESPLGGDSNCIFCPLKGFPLKVAIAQHEPALAKEWIKDEVIYKAQFRKEYSMKDIFEFAQRQMTFNFEDVGNSLTCGCTD